MSESKTEILNQDANNGILEKFFKIKAHGSSVKNELVGGVTTFATMAYIIFVNPQIMAASGMDAGAVFVATCIGAAIGCLLMGLFANWPVGLAPGMGLNAFFSFTVVSEMGYSWEVALGAVFISGILFVGMSFYKVRQWIIESIPVSLRYSMTAGVGLFLGLIGLKTAGIVVENPATLVSLGDFTKPEALLAAIAFLIIAVLSERKVFGAVLIGILSVTLVGMMLGLVHYNGFFAAPPSLAPTFLKMDIMGALDVSMISVILAFLFVNMFDTAGTLMGVAERANLTNPETGKIEGLSKALKADSISSVAGACVGCPPVTSYVESAAGVAAGARTGLSAIVVGVLFLAAIFLSPLAGMIPAYATSGALIYVAFVMMSSMQHVDWKDFTNGAPAAITALMMPLTFSIANGIALGFITYTVLKLATGKTKDVSISMYFLAAIFIAKLVFIG
ncbi:NCS2 family permease [Vibrio crassostreae]|uniref:NCS2 family permease n=1 Tax=Vibrio crassostreae TaxID=246167 RepID=UPI0006382C3A|nr:NCS2 family permease [Vibrio crassostreae]ROO55957.1 AGZA family xanthine/uracil permease-like MFS transporter [Vibrio crassostreae]ROO71333.1 AGZA family xanthine/uracil permease-like MFS transporter [Vibrio crassostreae]ROO73779.1 AGZA family xanthine/uracil permease-like MFS transporter [Vibrio crassostreae]ROR67984.1 AGZA family xanthine/uracil permease-like MFS transporter [Vibrio crassostreae]ROR70939.1 AGZA family xanthine/uracil permease-like MFS transporter [Vibrio crassostreae]